MKKLVPSRRSSSNITGRRTAPGGQQRHDGGREDAPTVKGQTHQRHAARRRLITT
jgi:hypothetical protein